MSKPSGSSVIVADLIAVAGVVTATIGGWQLSHAVTLVVAGLGVAFIAAAL